MHNRAIVTYGGRPHDWSQPRKLRVPGPAASDPIDQGQNLARTDRVVVDQCLLRLASLPDVADHLWQFRLRSGALVAAVHDRVSPVDTSVYTDVAPLAEVRMLLRAEQSKYDKFCVNPGEERERDLTKKEERKCKKLLYKIEALMNLLQKWENAVRWGNEDEAWMVLGRKKRLQVLKQQQRPEEVGIQARESAREGRTRLREARGLHRLYMFVGRNSGEYEREVRKQERGQEWQLSNRALARKRRQARCEEYIARESVKTVGQLILSYLTDQGTAVSRLNSMEVDEWHWMLPFNDFPDVG